tara:strand:+ start:10933 stop:11349 length:417 start_codon:yes stop_codon:yes gene_type:complete
MITAVNKKTVELILEESREALASVAKKHGITLKRKSCTYDPVKGEVPVAFKFVVQQLDEAGSVIDPMEVEFKRLATYFGLEPNDYGREFSTFNGTYRLTGIKTRAKKYPFIAEDVVTGKLFKFGRQQILHSLQKNTQG